MVSDGALNELFHTFWKLWSIYDSYELHSGGEIQTCCTASDTENLFVFLWQTINFALDWLPTDTDVSLKSSFLILLVIFLFSFFLQFSLYLADYFIVYQSKYC